MVGSALGGYADGGSRATPVLRRVWVSGDLELFDRVHRWTNHLGSQLLHVFGDGVVVHAIQDEVVLQRAYAMNIESARASEARAAALVGIALSLYAGHQSHQIVPPAQQQRVLGEIVVIATVSDRTVL